MVVRSGITATELTGRTWRTVHVPLAHVHQREGAGGGGGEGHRLHDDSSDDESCDDGSSDDESCDDGSGDGGVQHDTLGEESN